MFCNNCGSQLKDEAKFCTNCGQKIVVAEPVVANKTPAKKPVKVSVKKVSAAPHASSLPESEVKQKMISDEPAEHPKLTNNEGQQAPGNSPDSNNEVSMGDVANSLKVVVSNNLKKAASSLETMGNKPQGQDGQQSVTNIGTVTLNGEVDPRYTPITMWGYFGYEILFAIPLIGWIFLLVYAFGATSNINVKNFARSYFCLYIIVAVIALLVGAVAGGSLLFF